LPKIKVSVRDRRSREERRKAADKIPNITF